MSKGMNWTYDLRCSRCGRFCKIHDVGVPWGDSYSIDPPDEEIFCKDCADSEFYEAISTNRLIYCWWVKPAWFRAAKTVVRRRVPPISKYRCSECNTLNRAGSPCNICALRTTVSLND